VGFALREVPFVATAIIFQHGKFVRSEAAALAIMHTPFGFMAFLGIASLVGVIVSQVIVLFDFI
jgi:multidrug efflux pump subunit AcrB